jgi:uncharacterized membrane protein
MKSIDKKDIARVTMGLGLALIGVGHLTFLRKEFQAQVPDWVPLSKDDTVIYSGFAEIALGLSLALANDKYKDKVGKVAAAFFVAVFPGNISQYVHHRSAFGLETDNRRLARLFLQPALVYMALKSTSKN